MLPCCLQDRRTRFFRYARFPRLLKMLRLLRIRRVITRYSIVFPWVKAILKNYDLIKLFTIILLLGHLMACSWYYCSSEEPEVRPAQPGDRPARPA
eukprot:SAG22_NODE_243_length_14055_cov_3.073015_16_plen_96_part_00